MNVFSSLHGSMLQKQVTHFLVLRVVEGSGTPSVFWVDLYSFLDEELNDAKMATTGCQVEGRSHVVVSHLEVDA